MRSDHHPQPAQARDAGDTSSASPRLSIDSARRSLHFVGIGGAGMNALARYTLAAGHAVRGSDRRDSATLRRLEEAGAQVALGHDPSHVEDVDAVVISSAIPDDNVEVVSARERGVPILARGELLAELVTAHRGGIAICGTHGKGTTAGALVAMLEAAGEPVSYVLGAPLRSSGRQTRFLPDARWLVAEVDESDRTHLHHRPTHLLINNLEADHLDVYGSLDAIVASFETLVARFADRRPQGRCVLGMYGVGMQRLASRLSELGHAPLTCAVGRPADVWARPLETATSDAPQLELLRGERSLGTVDLALRGELNARNVVAAATLALELGLEPDAIRRAAASYDGLVDRFHEYAVPGGGLVVTDYTSHPTSILHNIEALRAGATGDAASGGRIHAVFQPFRYSLLSYHWDDYVEALARADAVHLAPMDAAGEAPIEGVGDAELAAAVGARIGAESAHCHASQEALETALRKRLEPGDRAIVFGGGPLFDMARRLVTWLRDRHGSP